jgi:hypothetical protein
MDAVKSATVKTVTFLLVMLVATAEAQNTNQWSFEHYPAVANLKSTPVKPLLRTHHDRDFRTQISTQSRNGPNFAGYFTIAKWGCGSPCTDFVIINMRTGTVYDPVQPVVVPVACADQNRADAGVRFELRSRLIVATGFSNKLGCGDNYLEWDGEKLKLIHFEPWPVPAK